MSQHLHLLLEVSVLPACIAFMQSLIASSATAAAVAPCILGCICIADDAEVSGASVKEKAIRIARMVRRRRSGWILQR